MNWGIILFIVGALIVGYFIRRLILGNPEAFSAAVVNKTLSTLAILALLFIGVVVFCVMMLKSG